MLLLQISSLLLLGLFQIASAPCGGVPYDQNYFPCQQCIPDLSCQFCGNSFGSDGACVAAGTICTNVPSFVTNNWVYAWTNSPAPLPPDCQCYDVKIPNLNCDFTGISRMGSPSGYQTCYQVNQINITQLVEAWGGPCLQAVQMDGNGCWSSIASYYCSLQCQELCGGPAGICDTPCLLGKQNCPRAQLVPNCLNFFKPATIGCPTSPPSPCSYIPGNSGYFPPTSSSGSIGLSSTSSSDSSSFSSSSASASSSTSSSSGFSTVAIGDATTVRSTAVSTSAAAASAGSADTASSESSNQQESSSSSDNTVLIASLVSLAVLMCLITLLIIGVIVFLKTREKRRETERKTELELQTVGPKIQLEQEARQSHSGRPLPPVPPHSRSYTSLQTPEPFYNTHTQYAETPKALSVSGFAHTSSSAALLPKPVGGRKDEWEIPYDELKLGKRIGEGSFGQVYIAEWRSVQVAVKQLGGVVTPKQVQDFKEEADIMKTLRPHPNCITLLGVCTRPGKPLCLVTEFFPMGSLEALAMGKAPMPKPMVLTILSGVAAGMAHIHKEGIIHRDLAARNVLLQKIDNAVTAKVCDFGLSRVTQEERTGQTKSNVGPLKWMAPESLLERVYSTKTDVWSFGVLMWEVVFRSEPYPDCDAFTAGAKIAYQGLRLPLPDKQSGLKFTP